MMKLFRQNSLKQAQVGSVLFALALAPFTVGCEKEEAPPPLPSTAPAPAPAPQTELKVEEEPLPEPSAAPSVKTGGTGKPASSLKNCCAALHQNAKSAPPPNNGYLETAAAICDGAVAAGSALPIGAMQAAAKGAGLPSSCM